MLRDPAEWRAFGLVADAFLWYLVAFATLLLYEGGVAGREDKHFLDRQH